MRNSVIERLSKTPDGQALIDLVEHAGGWSAFLRATGYTDAHVVNFYRRNKLSQIAARVISEIPYFRDAGWTKEKCLPSVGQYQWRDKLDWSKQAAECLKRRAKQAGVSVRVQREADK